MADKIHLNPETHEYTLNGRKIPGVTRILQETGLVDLSSIRGDVLMAAQKFGTAVHKACELEDMLILDTSALSAPLAPYVEGWAKFVDDFKVSFDSIEKMVYSKRWNYCGTLDRVVIIKKRLILVEIKSSTAMQPATGPQTAGYQIAYEEMTGKRIRQRWGVQLRGDGNYKIVVYDNTTDKDVFLAALNLYNWKIVNLKKG